MKAIVDPEKCVGCGICAEICPEVFAIEGDKAVVIADPVPKAAESSCKEAAANCGPEAITVK